MSERFSVCRGSLSPFVGHKLHFIFGVLKQFEVPITAMWSRFRTLEPPLEKFLVRFTMRLDETGFERAPHSSRILTAA
jgi:hypothetical protein